MTYANLYDDDPELVYIQQNMNFLVLRTAYLAQQHIFVAICPVSACLSGHLAQIRISEKALLEHPIYCISIHNNTSNAPHILLMTAEVIGSQITRFSF